MKKRFFNATVGGYYVVSVILGIAMALTVCWTVCESWDYAFDRYDALHDAATSKYSSLSLQFSDEGEIPALREKLGSMLDMLDETWCYLPMLSSWRWLHDVGNCAPIGLMLAAIATVVLSVSIMEGKSANKAWRQKMLQAIGCGLFIMLVSMAYQYASWRIYGELSTVVMLIPELLLLIPALILKKTRLQTRTNDAKENQKGE